MPDPDEADLLCAVPTGILRLLNPLATMVAVTIAALAPQSANAAPSEQSAEVGFYIGGEAWLEDSNTFAHGAAFIGARVPLSETLRLDLNFNSDTLEARLVRPWSTVEIGLRARGQLFYAEHFPTFIRDGQRVPELGFRASTADLGIFALWLPAHWQWVRVDLSARRWFFAPLSSTDPDLRLPPDSVEGRLTLAWGWRRTVEEPMAHRPFERIEGFAITTQFGAIQQARSETREWGEPLEPFPTRPTYRTSARPFEAHAELTTMGGFVIGDNALRIHARQHAFAHSSRDDRYRPRVGGLAPWTYSVPGLAWASVVSQVGFGGEIALVPLPNRPIEVGVIVAMHTNNSRGSPDPALSDNLSTSLGVGPTLDARFGPWQLDARAGAALLTPWPTDHIPLGAWLSLGRGFGGGERSSR